MVAGAFAKAATTDALDAATGGKTATAPSYIVLVVKAPEIAMSTGATPTVSGSSHGVIGILVDSSQSPLGGVKVPAERERGRTKEEGTKAKARLLQHKQLPSRSMDLLHWACPSRILPGNLRCLLPLNPQMHQLPT